MSHKMGSLVFGAVVGVLVAIWAYQWVSDPLQRERCPAGRRWHRRRDRGRNRSGDEKHRAGHGRLKPRRGMRHRQNKSWMTETTATGFTLVEMVTVIVILGIVGLTSSYVTIASMKIYAPPWTPYSPGQPSAPTKRQALAATSSGSPATSPPIKQPSPESE